MLKTALKRVYNIKSINFIAPYIPYILYILIAMRVIWSHLNIATPQPIITILTPSSHRFYYTSTLSLSLVCIRCECLQHIDIEWDEHREKSVKTFSFHCRRQQRERVFLFLTVLFEERQKKFYVLNNSQMWVTKNWRKKIKGWGT